MTRDEVIDLIADSGFATLATIEGDQPHARPMVPYLLEDDKQLIVALLGSSRTIEQVKKNPKVEVCFVDRKMWFARVSGEGKITEKKKSSASKGSRNL